MYGRGRFMPPGSFRGNPGGGFRGGYGGGVGGGNFGGGGYGGGRPPYGGATHQGQSMPGNRPFRPRNDNQSFRGPRPEVKTDNKPVEQSKEISKTSPVKAKDEPANTDSKADAKPDTTPTKSTPENEAKSGGGAWKRPHPEDSKSESPAKKAMLQAEVDPDQPIMKNPESTILDFYNSDLNLSIAKDGLTAENVTEPNGFCFVWGGARANHGVYMGKVCYEVKIVDLLKTDFGPEHTEQDPHVLRVGWSIDSTSFQLGEEPFSYGYGGTSKFSTDCKFTNYGERFTKGDVITCLVDFQERPPNISFSKNGRWFGIAKRLTELKLGDEKFALFPHILSKNVRFEVNFGTQQPPWKPTPPGFTWIDHVAFKDKVLGMQAPARKQDCEMIMMVGLPGVGKTTWAEKKAKEAPEKRFNIIGTDSLIDKMKVQGLPRRRNFSGRWDNLISMAGQCLNKLFAIGSKRRRNYILDQTNVYPRARVRKMSNFTNFKRICAVLVPSDAEMKRRSAKRTKEDGKEVPESAVLEMKANFTLPSEQDPHVDQVIWIELSKAQCEPIVTKYNEEGQSSNAKGPAPRGGMFGGQGGRGDGPSPAGRGESPMGGAGRGAPFGRGRGEQFGDRGGRFGGPGGAGRGAPDRQPWQQDAQTEDKYNNPTSTSWPPSSNNDRPSRWGPPADEQEVKPPTQNWGQDQPAWQRGGAHSSRGGADRGRGGAERGRGGGPPGRQEWGKPQEQDDVKTESYDDPWGGSDSFRGGAPRGRGGDLMGRGRGDMGRGRGDMGRGRGGFDSGRGGRGGYDSMGAGRGGYNTGYDSPSQGGYDSPASRGGYEAGGGHGGYDMCRGRGDMGRGRGDMGRGRGDMGRGRGDFGGRGGHGGYEMGRGRSAPSWGGPEESERHPGQPEREWGRESESIPPYGRGAPRGRGDQWGAPPGRGGRGAGGWGRGEDRRPGEGDNVGRPGGYGTSQDEWGQERSEGYGTQDSWGQQRDRAPAAGRGQWGGQEDKSSSREAHGGWSAPKAPEDNWRRGSQSEHRHEQWESDRTDAPPYGQPPKDQAYQQPSGVKKEPEPWRSQTDTYNQYSGGYGNGGRPPAKEETEWKQQDSWGYDKQSQGGPTAGRYDQPPPGSRDPASQQWPPPGQQQGQGKQSRWGEALPEDTRQPPPGGAVGFGRGRGATDNRDPVAPGGSTAPRQSRWEQTTSQGRGAPQDQQGGQQDPWKAGQSGYGNERKEPDYNRAGYGGAQPQTGVAKPTAAGASSSYGQGAQQGYGYDQQAADNQTKATEESTVKEEDYSQYEAQGWRWEVSEDGQSGQWVWRPDLVKDSASKAADTQGYGSTATGSAATPAGQATGQQGYGGQGYGTDTTQQSQYGGAQQGYSASQPGASQQPAYGGSTGGGANPAPPAGGGAGGGYGGYGGNQWGGAGDQGGAPKGVAPPAGQQGGGYGGYDYGAGHHQPPPQSQPQQQQYGGQSGGYGY